MIKQCFQFLNTLCLCSKHEDVFHIGQCLEIGGSVIALYSIKVVNNPSVRQGSAINLFPNHNVFPNPPQCISTMMFGLFNYNIAKFICIPIFCIKHSQGVLALYFHRTATAPCGIFCDGFSAIKARMPLLSPPVFLVLFALIHIIIILYREMFVKSNKERGKWLKAEIPMKVDREKMEAELKEANKLLEEGK